MMVMSKTASSSADKLQYQWIGPVPASSCVMLFGKKNKSKSVMLEIVPNSHLMTAKEMMAGKTSTSPVRKLERQRANRLFCSMPQSKVASQFAQGKAAGKFAQPTIFLALH